MCFVENCNVAVSGLEARQGGGLTYDFTSALQVSLDKKAEDEVEEAPSTFEAQYSLQTLNVPLSWGLGQVPETQIVAHVPGTHRSSCLLHYGLITLET